MRTGRRAESDPESVATRDADLVERGGGRNPSDLPTVRRKERRNKRCCWIRGTSGGDARSRDDPPPRGAVFRRGGTARVRRDSGAGRDLRWQARHQAHSGTDSRARGRYAHRRLLSHKSEQLSKAAEAIFGKGTAQATQWYETYRARLREEAGGAVATVRSLRYCLKTLPRRSERFRVVRRLIKRLTANLDKLNYAGFRARRLPIGSGPVEASCKNLVGARLKRSGMRWPWDGGQEVLNLRAPILPDRCNVFWGVYQTSKAAA